MQVHGEITKFRADIGFGVITGEDGRKYRFAKSELVNTDADLIGNAVDFMVVANRPTEIIVLDGTPWTVFGRA
ncbi:MAG: hypothetical protein JNM89_17065 [Hyphomicrobiaceae bacterium]|nr:hypothetical protein [Hyphomicrobiaceae bacterium]